MAIIKEVYTNTSTSQVTTSWIVPFGVTKVTVSIWAAGGGGGTTAPGGGGGGGGFLRVVDLVVNPRDLFSIQIPGRAQANTTTTLAAFFKSSDTVANWISAKCGGQGATITAGVAGTFNAPGTSASYASYFGFNGGSGNLGRNLGTNRLYGGGGGGSGAPQGAGLPETGFGNSAGGDAGNGAIGSNTSVVGQSTDEGGGGGSGGLGNATDSTSGLAAGAPGGGGGGVGRGNVSTAGSTPGGGQVWIEYESPDAIEKLSFTNTTSSSITGTWTVPAGVTKVSVQGWGGGGGCGASTYQGGGGGGAYTEVYNLNVTPGQTFAYNVGIGSVNGAGSVTNFHVDGQANTTGLRANGGSAGQTSGGNGGPSLALGTVFTAMGYESTISRAGGVGNGPNSGAGGGGGGGASTPAGASSAIAQNAYPGRNAGAGGGLGAVGFASPNGEDNVNGGGGGYAAVNSFGNVAGNGGTPGGGRGGNNATAYASIKGGGGQLIISWVAGDVPPAYIATQYFMVF